jgi:hypothetical protein
MDSRDDLLKRIANLEHKLDVLVENRVGILEDIEEIKRLQRMYGYYIDLCLWEPMADLFAEKGAAIEIGSRGRYVGKDNVLKFLRDVNGNGVSGLRRLQVINHMQGQGIVTVAPDRTHAQGRWRGVVQAGGGPQRQAIPGSAPAAPATGGPPGSLSGGAMMYAEGRVREHLREGERRLEDRRAVLGADVLRFARLPVHVVPERARQRRDAAAARPYSASGTPRLAVHAVPLRPPDYWRAGDAGGGKGRTLRGVTMKLRLSTAILIALALAGCTLVPSPVSAPSAGNELTRAQFVAQVSDYFGWHHASGYNDYWKVPLRTFADVKAEDPYGKQIENAYEEYVISPDARGGFNPTARMTREDAAVIFAKAYFLPMPSDASALNAFGDAGAISDAAKPSVAALVAAGFMAGRTRSTFAPAGCDYRCRGAGGVPCRRCQIGRGGPGHAEAGRGAPHAAARRRRQRGCGRPGGRRHLPEAA